MRVLITDSELKQALAITQSLGRKGIAVSCLSSNRAASSFYSKYCQEKFISPYLSDKENYINSLLEIVKNKKHELLFTCSDAATEYISELRGKLIRYIGFVVPDHENIVLALNKDKLMRFCQERGFPIPRTAYPKSRQDILALDGEVNYPLVLKGSRGACAQHVRYAESKDELLAAYSELKGKAPEVIIQEYIAGDNYGYYGLCDEGEVFAFFIFKTIRSYPATGGTPSKAISFYDAKLEEFARKILRELHWSGFVNIDFMKDTRDGEYKLLEINPRFGGTTPLAISCGVDFPMLLYEFVVEGRESTCNNYKIGKIYRSLFREEVLHAFERPRVIPQMLFELFNPFVSYGIHLADLAPLIGMAKTLGWELKNKLARN